jgi:hypothetical protein
MKLLDKAFAVALGAFFVGSSLGALAVIMSPSLLAFTLQVFRARMLAPVKTISAFGSYATFLFIFLNNSIPPALSFLYPFVLARVGWEPPLTEKRRWFLMSSFTLLSSFLLGFFDLGTPLAVVWVIGGANGVSGLLLSAWFHGPLEFSLILLCLAEPLRLASETAGLLAALRKDAFLLVGSILGLLFSAAVEVFLVV